MEKRVLIWAIVPFWLLTVALDADKGSETDVDVTVSPLLLTAKETPTTTTEEPDRNAEIVFDDLYHLVYNNKKMLRLQQCLCDPKNSFCNTTIKLPGNSRYEFEFRADDIEGERNVGEEYGNETFLCHAGDFSILQTFVCSKRKDYYQRCLKQKTCRFVHFKFEDVSGCESKSDGLNCINLALSGYSVEFRNFSENAEFRDGACEEHSPSSTTASAKTASTTSEPQSPATKSTLIDANSDKEDILFIIAVIGWALFFLALIIILILFTCIRRSKKAAMQKELVSEKSKVNHNGSYGLSNISQRDGGDHVQLPAPPPEVRYEETGRGSIDQQDDSPYLDCEEDDDVYTVIEDETVSNGVTKNTTVKGVKQKPTHNAVPLKTAEENAFTKSSLKYGNLTGAGGPRPAIKNTNELRKDGVESKALGLETQPPKQRDTEFENDYTRLVSGRIDMDSKATDSFLATYNARNDDTDEADAKGERNSENIPYNVNNVEEEKSDSAAYTLVEPENEHELFRDSNGYITVIEEGPVKEKPKTDNALLSDSAGYATVNKEGSVKTKPFTNEEQVNKGTHVPNSSGYTQANKGQYKNVKLFDKEEQEKNKDVVKGFAGCTASTNEASSKDSVLPNDVVVGKPDSTQTLKADVGTRLSEVCSTAEQVDGSATGQASSDTSISIDPYSVAHPITSL